MSDGEDLDGAKKVPGGHSSAAYWLDHLSHAQFQSLSDPSNSGRDVREGKIEHMGASQRETLPTRTSGCTFSIYPDSAHNMPETTPCGEPSVSLTPPTGQFSILPGRGKGLGTCPRSAGPRDAIDTHVSLPSWSRSLLPLTPREGSPTALELPRHFQIGGQH